MSGRVARVVNKRPSELLPEEVTGTSDFEKLMFDAVVLRESAPEESVDPSQMSTAEKIKYKRRHWPKEYQ